MRVLWVDADGNPWTDANGWRVLEDFGVLVDRVSTAAEAQAKLSNKNFDLVLVRAELKGAPALLVQARKQVVKDGRKILLISSEWSKEQFRTHSKTEGAAHRYARVPMPPEGYLNLLADLFGCTVEELADFEVSAEPEEIEIPVRPPIRTERPKRAASAHDESGDLDVLRKYLTIKEEQLELSESERQELARENERLQKEAQHLQLKLREFEHLQEELAKKLAHMEEERAESERKAIYEREVNERELKNGEERIRGLETQLSETSEKYEDLRVRVRKDIRKIRENERDLEARLELSRKDSDTLLRARDEKVLDLQRKIDALEFDLDQVQDSRVQAQMEAERYLAKLSRVSRALQVANSLIEDDRASDSELDDLEPIEGGAANAEEAQAQDSAAGRAAAPAAASLPNREDSGGEEPSSAEEEQVLSEEFAALANEGEPTQMISMHDLQKAGGDSGSSSG